MAVILTSLMGLAGAGVDYGLIVVETSRLQNALDAASLAGARALVTSTGTSQSARDTDGEAAAVTYLGLHGYVNGQNGGTFTYVKSSSDTTSGANHDTMQVTGTIVKPTSFWKVIGINSTTLTRTATAVASGGMVDVMMSLDLSGSMQLSGTDDLGNLQDAVVAFINQMQLSTTDPRGSQVGIARWAGVNCSWTRGNPVANTRTPTPATQPDGDTRIDFLKGPTPTGEYSTPCYDDATVLSFLSQDKNILTRIANNAPATPAVCPTKPAAAATAATSYSRSSPGAATDYGCPLKSWLYPYTSVPQANGTPTPITGVDNHTWYGMTGTKLSNSLKIVNGDLTGCYAWATSTASCATNGRNDPATTGLARKVLVIMTDGFSETGTESLPSGYPTYTTIATPVATAVAPSSWDKEAVDLADKLKRGADNNASTTDDNVEIYVVGFYCNNLTASSTAISEGWCASTLAVTAQPHPCPGTTWPTTSPAPSGIDTLLRTISSSKAGTCDHYFPIQKTEDLPQLFRVMAGSIARGRLQ